MIYLGIDPGLSGALAVLHIREHGLPIQLDVFDMPILAIEVNGKVKRRVDLPGLSWYLETPSLIKANRRETIALAVCENPNSMPEQGTVSAFNFGYTCGATHGILAALGIPHRLVRPAAWKRAMGLTADKDATRYIASQRFPAFSHLWARKKDDGRAEAALLALYASTLT